jgi:glycosyltransferase involved in cell wall biosynthesis
MVGLNDQLIAFIKSNNSHCLFDLLDDWTIHPAFKDIAKDVDYGYRALFEVASAVSANSEGTYELACRYGRPDVILLPNGCDPDLFSGVSHASGPTTIGYAGKLGFRLDVELIVEVCESLPHCNFLFAGPTIDKEPVRRIRNLANVELIGDVPYSKYPDLLTRFDIGWIPHRTGAGEIGGDAIKVYEYRASGLPVVMTPIIGSSRAPSGVIVGPREGVLSALQKLLRNAHGYRIQRAMAPFPEELTWKYKALLELKSVGIHQTDTS